MRDLELEELRAHREHRAELLAAGKCTNCEVDGPADPAHPDLCCTCFVIAFGEREHREEHIEAGRANGTPAPAPRYTCVYCGGEFTATPEDVAEVRARWARDGDYPDEYPGDAAAFREFGRDVCPAHAGASRCR